jgi:nucleotide-binding universal stress UspA family protein
MELLYQRFVVPVDGSQGDDRVLDVIRFLADRQPVSVTLVYVVEVLQSMPLDAELPAEVARGEAVLKAAEAATRAIGGKTPTVHTELLQARATGAAIVDEAIERNADVILMAATTRRHHGKTTVGETVNYVLKNAPCEVVVVRLPPADADAGNPTWA